MDPVHSEASWKLRVRASCFDSRCEELGWHQVLAPTWYLEMPEAGLLVWSRRIGIGVDFLEWSRPGVIDIGCHEWSRPVVAGMGADP